MLYLLVFEAQCTCTMSKHNEQLRVTQSAFYALHSILTINSDNFPIKH